MLCRLYVLFYKFIVGAFAKLRKSTFSFVMSVRLSVCMEQLGSCWTDLYEICYFKISQKYIERAKVSLKSDQSDRYCT